MANHKSAEKRAKQNENRRLRNKMVKSRMKTIIKAVRMSDGKNPEETQTVLNEAKSVISKAAKKGVIHHNTAARKISRLSKFVNSLSA